MQRQPDCDTRQVVTATSARKGFRVRRPPPIRAKDASSPAYYVHGCVIASQTGVRLTETFQGRQRRWVALRNGYVHLVDPDHARSNSSEEHRGDGFRLRKYRNQQTQGPLAGDW